MRAVPLILKEKGDEFLPSGLAAAIIWTMIDVYGARIMGFGARLSKPSACVILLADIKRGEKLRDFSKFIFRQYRKVKFRELGIQCFGWKYDILNLRICRCTSSLILNV